jgi:hypothetical protein
MIIELEVGQGEKKKVRNLKCFGIPFQISGTRHGLGKKCICKIIFKFAFKIIGILGLNITRY